ncbi:efflux RND transporter periplasmic adaptor subunit [Enterobacter asburiae]|uniref:efflux RND transporter periplasmic adaptor subunit n=1 Tax=Enterobacter asburiae TaxID=61645 RepID=UPI003D6E0EEC
MQYHKKHIIQKPLTSVSGLGVCAFSMLLLLTGCDDSQVAPASLRPVKTWVVQEAQHVPPLTWTGTIEPSEEVTLQFRIDGKLARKLVDVGAKVTKNQPVALLSGSMIQGEKAAAVAEYQEAVAAEQKGRQELERTKKLFAIGTASRAQLEEAVSSVAALNARKARAQAQKDAALNESDFSTLRAPFDGVVTSYLPYSGQTIAAGQDILKVSSSKAEVQFSVSSGLASKLHAGDPVSVNDGVSRIKGQIRYITPQLDSSTRTSLVRATLSAAENEPVFGSAVSVELSAYDDTVIPLPASALTRAGNQPAVFIVDPKLGKLVIRPINIVRFSDDKAYVSSGLKAGEKVVTAGVNTLQDGEKVDVSAEAMK